MKAPIEVRPEKKIRLKDIPTDHDAGLGSKEKARARLDKDLEKLRELQHLLYADNRYSLLVVLQAMDTGGKDGTIRHVMSGLNPVGCEVTSFKAPTDAELEQDFLWRVHQAVPAKGMIGVFNRSHYEDVLVVRVREIVPKKVWGERYWQINAFERMLTENGVVILKFFLHISKAEQARRLKERLKDKEKHWKFSPSDLKERKLWADYQEAYEDAINECTTEWAPWVIVPADNIGARSCWDARAMVERLESLRLRFPKPATDLSLAIVE